MGDFARLNSILQAKQVAVSITKGSKRITTVIATSEIPMTDSTARRSNIMITRSSPPVAYGIHLLIAILYPAYIENAYEEWYCAPKFYPIRTAPTAVVVSF